MIIWISGNSSAGKTTLAKKLLHSEAIHLDGDDLRKKKDLGFSKEDRWQHNLEVAFLAKSIEDRYGLDIIVSVICPYKELREKVKEICGCTFIYLLDGKKSSKKYPYEKPNDVTNFEIYV